MHILSRMKEKMWRKWTGKSQSLGEKKFAKYTPAQGLVSRLYKEFMKFINKGKKHHEMWTSQKMKHKWVVSTWKCSLMATKITTTTIYHFPIPVGQDWRDLHHTHRRAVERDAYIPTLEKCLAVAYKTKHPPTLWPSVPFLRIYPREIKYVHRKICEECLQLRESQLKMGKSPGVHQ